MVRIQLVVDAGERLVQNIHDAANHDAVEEGDRHSEENRDYRDEGNSWRCNTVELANQESNQLADQLADLDEDEKKNKN